MKLSTKGRYALRLMLDLALQPQDNCTSLKSVSQRQEISLKYLEQIVTPLIRCGYVRSVRGAQGGYQLTRPPWRPPVRFPHRGRDRTGWSYTVPPAWFHSPPSARSGLP